MSFYNNKSDIWALGCILHEITTTRKAFIGDWEVMEQYRSGRRLELGTESYYSWLAHFNIQEAGTTTDLIHDMLQTDYRKRPSAASLVAKLKSMCSEAFPYKLYISKSELPFAIYGVTTLSGTQITVTGSCLKQTTRVTP
jgi:serine/threonine protein kinase